jgi:hypothetical protein
MIRMIKGTKTHSRTRSTCLNQLIPLGRGGRMVQLKKIQVKLVNKVNLNNKPVIRGRL